MTELIKVKIVSALEEFHLIVHALILKSMNMFINP